MLLDPTRPYWVPALTAPVRDWAAAPGCRRGARLLIEAATLQPGKGAPPLFDSRADCLRWIMANRAALERGAPGARIVPAPLAQWLLGMA